MNRPMIELREVRKSFGPQEVLKGLCFEVAEGETVVVIGRSGCGKSVMLKHICGLMRPDSGEVRVAGERVDDRKERHLVSIRRKIGFVFQGAALFDSLDVRGNLALSLVEQRLPRREIDERVRRALAQVELEGIETKMPSELSGGMKKRVGLARAIVGDPSIILYDEPTTGLDPVTADSINELILHLKHRLRITSVAVTHDMTSAYRIADRIAMLHDGRIRFVGTPEEIRSCDDAIVRQFVEGRARLEGGE